MNGIAHIHNLSSGQPTRKGWWTAVLLGGCIGSTVLLTPIAGIAQTIWRGSGQIINGRGSGGRLELVLETHNGRIRTRSGPDLNASFRQGGSQTVENREGTWQIEHRGDRLNVTLYRESQVIRYQLEVDERSNESSHPSEDRVAPDVAIGTIDVGSFSLEALELNSPEFEIPAAQGTD